MGSMNLAKKVIYAVLAAFILMATGFLFSIVSAPKLEFRDHAFPPGFRNLVLESGTSQIDPLFGQQRSYVNSTPKLNAREVCDALFRYADSPSIGNRNSQIQIIAFLDYRCPYCKKLSPILSKMHDDNVRIIYKEWPILGDSSLLAARAALAADKQGKYLAFHTRLMSSRFIPNAAYIEEIAVELGMNRSQLRVDIRSAAVTRAIEHTSALASALGLVGTPALVVGRTVVQGEITQRQLERLIDDEVHLPQPGVC